MDTSEISYIDINRIKESSLNPRKEFRDLDELADDLAKRGMLQPIMVRPADKSFELVFGARRLRAAKIAGIKKVPAIVRKMDDDAALETMIVENLKRDNIHELDEAKGLRSLLECPGYDVAAVSAKVGKDESYVYKRLKLLDLIESAQKAFLDGEINAGHAVLISRLQPDDQAAALDNCFKDQFGMTRHGAERMARPVKELAQWINSNVHLVLSGACFKSTDKSLIPGVPSCVDCLKRTGSNAKLFSDIAQKDICTDPKCFAAKQQAHIEKTVSKGGIRKVTTHYEGKDKDVLPASKYHRIEEKEDRCDSMEKAVIVAGYRDIGKVIEICADEKCSMHGKSVSGRNADTDKYAKQQKREEERRKQRREIRRRVLDEVLERTKEVLGLPETELQLLGIWNLLGSDLQRAVATRRGWEKIERKGGYGIDYDAMMMRFLNSMDPEEATRFAVEISLVQQVDSDPGAYGGRDRLMEFARLKEIDAKKISSEVAVEFKQKAKEKAKKAKSRKPSKSSEKQEAAEDPAETVCENCAGPDGEKRDCGHIVCENCYTGGCPVCAEEEDGQ